MENFPLFSMQATLWKKKTFQDILNVIQSDKWLENIRYHDYMKDHNIKGIYYYDNEKKRGSNHFNSKVFPYIATAIVGGRWNTGEYSQELEDFFREYNINKTIRGSFTGDYDNRGSK
jgi:hypothetical protein